MTGDLRNETIPSSDVVRDVLGRARQVDPTCEEAAIRGYVREIAEADAVLDPIDLGDAPLLVSFSSSAPDGCAR